MPSEKESGSLEFWAILELFGHSRIAGYVKEVSLGGDAMLRVDVPAIKYQERTGWGDSAKLEERSIAAFTKFYSPKSVFAMTPCTQEAATAAMQSFRVQPINAFELTRAALPAPGTLTDSENDDEIDEDDIDLDDDDS